MADPNKIELLLEAERRGILPPEKKTLLDEARKRGLIGGTSEQKLVSASSDPEEETQDTSGDIKSKIDSIVSKSVLNPSENLKIDPSDVENFKKNPYAGVNLKERDQYITTLEDGHQVKSPVNKTRLLNAADTYTAGLGIKGGALIDALVNKIQGQNSMGLEPSVVDEVDNRDEFGQIYDDSLKDFRAKMKEMNKQNPADALIGQIVGLVAPMGAFSNATKAASAIPFISKLLKSTKNVVDGGKIVAKPAILKMLLGQALRGGTANALFGQVNQDLDASGGDRLKKGLTDFGVGAAFDAGPSALWQGLKGTGKGFLSGLIGAKNVGKKIADKVSGGFFSKREAEKVLANIDDFTMKTTGASTSREAAEKATQSFDDIMEESGKEYSNIIDPINKKFGSSEAQIPNLKKSMIDKLSKAGLVDDAGNIIEESANFELTPEGKGFLNKITRQVFNLKKNPTFSELNQLVKDIGKLSRFTSKRGSESARSFRDIYFAAKDDLLNNIQTLTVKKGKNSKIFKQAEKSYSQNIEKAGNVEQNLIPEVKSDLKNYEKFNKGFVPEKGNEAVNAKISDDARKFYNTKISNLKQEAEAANIDANEAKSVMQDMIEQFEKQGMSAKEAVTQARKKISDIIDISNGEIGSLTKIRPEMAIKGAKNKIVGSAVDEALQANEKFADPVRKLIAGDLKKSLDGKLQKIRGSKATNSGVEALEGVQDDALDILNNYTPETLRKLFSPKEMAFFEKLAGTYKKQPGNMQKSGAYILKLLKGAPIAPLVSNQNR